MSCTLPRRTASCLAITVLVSTLSIHAQTLPNACGPDNAKFDVKTTGDTSIPAPQPGMATVVFLEDQLQQRPGHSTCLKCAALVRFGMDGKWIAATHGFSHTAVSVPPGDHHFCITAGAYTFQSPPLPSFYGLHLEAGQTYFLRARLSLFGGIGLTILDLTRINDDEGRYLNSITQHIQFKQK